MHFNFEAPVGLFLSSESPSLCLPLPSSAVHLYLRDGGRFFVFFIDLVYCPYFHKEEGGGNGNYFGLQV